jgi:hypothetical protein
MSKVYMGLGFYDIPNQFSDAPFDSSVEVDAVIKQQFEDSAIVLTWDGTQLVPFVIE